MEDRARVLFKLLRSRGPRRGWENAEIGYRRLFPRATTELGPAPAGLGVRVYIGRDHRGERKVINLHICIDERAEC